MKAEKVRFLTMWANNLQMGVDLGKLGKTRQQLTVTLVPGPRVAGLDIYSPADPVGLKKAMADGGSIAVAHTVPWEFLGDINVFSHGKLLRVEAPWPDNLSENNVALKSIKSTHEILDTWVSGTDDNGHVIQPGFYLANNFLFAGETGSGKSIALTSAVAQLAKGSNGVTRFVLIDGKMGESLFQFSALPGLVGPVATDINTAAKALAWTVSEMIARYTLIKTMGPAELANWVAKTPRIVVVVDEVQSITQDAGITQMLAQLLSQGRAAKISLLISTQHPINSVLGNDATIKANIGGRIALKVNSQIASRVVLGIDEPDATKLLGHGDSYVLANGRFARVQTCFMTRRDIGLLSHGQPEMLEWPEPELSATPYEEQRKNFLPPPEGSLPYIAIQEALVAAMNKEGEPKLRARFEAQGLGTSHSYTYEWSKFGKRMWKVLTSDDLPTLPEEDK